MSKKIERYRNDKLGDYLLEVLNDALDNHHRKKKNSFLIECMIEQVHLLWEYDRDEE